MRVFQTIHAYKAYIPYFEEKYDKKELEDISFEELRKKILEDRFYSTHILKPCLEEGAPNGFYTLWTYPLLQEKWAREKGWKETDLKKILFAQIEEFHPDVFYNQSPIMFSAKEVNAVGVNKMIKLAWFASPEKKDIDFTCYHSRLTNFPLDANKTIEKDGYRSDLFQPAFDPIMSEYALNENRPIDILFFGQYSAFFKERNFYIDRLAELKKKKNWNIILAVQYKPQYAKIYPFSKPPIISRLLNRVDLKFNRYPPESISNEFSKPIYGLDLYEYISKSKIVFNAAVDFTGQYKVNMRNFEALGCGSHMISDAGIYPDGFRANDHFSTYTSLKDFLEKATYFLENPAVSRQIATQGHKMLKNRYSKENQWSEFQRIVAEVS